MARKLRSNRGSAIYDQRKAIVEPVNGQVKEVRGLRRFLLRGLEMVDGEWHLIAATHNLLKLWRLRDHNSRCWQWPPPADEARCTWSIQAVGSAGLHGQQHQSERDPGGSVVCRARRLYGHQTPRHRGRAVKLRLLPAG